MNSMLRARIAVSISVVLLLAALAIPTAFASQATPEASDVSSSLPAVTAKAVVVKDVSLGAELYSLNPNERRPPASLTKLATALVILEQADSLDELIIVDSEDVLDASQGQSMVGAVAGDVFTLHDMMYGLLLNSGNDFANTLARHYGQKMLDAEGGAGDPIERFIDEMNATVERLWLTDTQFRNVEGLYDPDHFTTASDFAVIAELVLAEPLVSEVVGTQSYSITSLAPGGATYQLENTNRLLGEDGVNGAKTGTLSQSGACLIATKQGPGGTKILSVVLGSDIQFDENGFQIPESDMRYTDTESIFAAMEEDYRWIDPLTADSMRGLSAELDVWDVGFDDQLPVLFRASQTGNLRYLVRLDPPGEAGSSAGEVQFYDGDQLVAEKPVVELSAAA